jgi:hypothetical protein
LGLTADRTAAAACIDRFCDELDGEVDATGRFFGALDTLIDMPVSPIQIFVFN